MCPTFLPRVDANVRLHVGGGVGGVGVEISANEPHNGAEASLETRDSPHPFSAARAPSAVTVTFTLPAAAHRKQQTGQVAMQQLHRAVSEIYLCCSRTEGGWLLF